MAKRYMILFVLWSYLHEAATLVDVQIMKLNHSTVLPDAGDVVTIESIIAHSNISSSLTYNTTFFITDLSPYLLASNNSAVINTINSSGTISTFTFLVSELNSGYQVSKVLNLNEAFFVEFNLTVSELVYPEETLSLNLTISYKDNGSAVMNVTEVLFITTASVPFPQLILADTSFTYTTGNSVTIDEIIQFNVTQTVPEGNVNLSIIIDFPSTMYLLDYNITDYPQHFQINSVSKEIRILDNLLFNISIYNPSNQQSPDRLSVTITGLFIDGQNGDKLLVTTANQFEASTEYLYLFIVEPCLVLDVILEGQFDDALSVAVDINIFHTYSSKSPAFDVVLTQHLPEHFSIHYIESTYDYNILIKSDTTGALKIFYDELDLYDSIHVLYYAAIDTDALDDVAINITFYLDYTNLVYMSEGLALEHPGKIYSKVSEYCVIKRRNNVLKTEKISLVGSFFAGLLAGIILALVICLIVRFFRNRKGKRTSSVTPEVEIISEHKLYYNIFEENKATPDYIASFLTNSWKERHDTYEVLLAQNISLVENDMYFTAIRQLVTKSVEELLQSKVLSFPGKQTLRKELHSKIKTLRNATHSNYEKSNKELQQAIKKELHDKRHALKQQHQQQIELILEYCTNQELAILEDMQEKEIKELESSFKVFLNLRRLILKSKYITNYFLHIKEILQTTMQLPIPDHPLMIHLKQHAKNVEEHVVKHLVEMKTDLSIQCEKEQLILMRKQLLEDEDIKWKVYLLKISEKAISFMNRNIPSIKDIPVIAEFHKTLSKHILGKYQDLMEGLCKREHKIVKQAMHKDSSVALEMMTKEWKRHRENVTQLVDFITTVITERLSDGALYNGSEVEQLLETIRSDREEVVNDIQRSHVLRKAKLQANIENQRTALVDMHTVLHKEFEHRREKDEETLHKIVASNSVNKRENIIKEHQEDMSLLLKSFALEEIINYWIASEKCIERRIRKVRSKWSKWQLRNDDHRKSGEIEWFLVHDCIQSGWDSLIKAWEEGLIASNTQYHEILKSLWSPQSIISQDEQQPLVAPMLATPLPIEKPVVSMAHKELLATHKEELSQIDARLEEEKSQAIKELELRIHEKKIGHKNIQELTMAVPMKIDMSTAGDGSMMSQWMLHKFKQAVWRVIEDIQYEKARKIQEQQYNEHIQQIEDMYEAKKTRAFEKMNNNFEAQLQNIEGPLKEEEISSIFKDLSNWKHLSVKRRKTNRKVSIAGDPLLMKHRKPHFLPPISET